MAARSLTFPQENPQPKPHVPIQIGKLLGGVAHAEIVPPSSDHPIQARHQFRKVYPQTAPLGLLPDLGAHQGICVAICDRDVANLDGTADATHQS